MAHHDQHEHVHQVALPLHHGLVSAPRVEDHPAGEAGEDIGNCGLCGAMIWVTRRIEHFRAMRPWVPVLCCRCFNLSRSALKRALPDLQQRFGEVPDLARQGVFN